MAGEKTFIKLPEPHPAVWHPIERLLAHRRSVHKGDVHLSWANLSGRLNMPHQAYAFRLFVTSRK